MKVRVSLAVALCLVCCTHALAVDIETVPVGNPGNADDTQVMSDGTTGYGRVDYEYDIGKYEVTAGQYTDFLNAVAATDTYGLYSSSMWSGWSGEYGCGIQRSGFSGSYTYSVPDANYVNRPVTFVSWGDAARFCNWLENGQPTGTQDLTTTEDGSYYLNGAMTNAELLAVTRHQRDGIWALPTEDEWYKAAYHKNDGATGNYFDYPTTNNSTPSNELINPDPGNNATYCAFDGEFTYTIDSPYWRTEFGAHENSESPYGTFDQGGNVYEWNEAILSGSGMRGGSFDSHWGELAARARVSWYTPSNHYLTVGFRVAEVPEPVTLTLLAFGGAAVLVRRRGVGR